MISLPSYEKSKTEKNVLVPMRDGVELALDVHRPEETGPYPVILSVYPYHKDGMVGSSNLNQISYFVKRGYAYVTADCRGTGNSSGVSIDPLDGLNGDDLYDVTEWVAAQLWCDGSIGMTGMSYGGMTALKAASINPPHLKAIVPIMAPSAFYHNLAFPGGSLNMLGLCGAWCGLMHCMNLMPPFYQDPDGRWEKIWQEHLDQYKPYLIGPLDHLTYDDYWKGHDIELEKIEIPIYIFEGWRDFALVDGIRQYTSAKGPKKILVGPWIHFNLDLISIEPFDYLHEMCRWFDYWLKGMDNGITKEPPIALCVQGSNEWRFENDWPLSSEKKKTWSLGKNKILLAGVKATADFALEYPINPAVGTQAGLMTVMPLGIDFPHDQRRDDALSLTFDGAPLKADLEIVGEPTCTLFVSSTIGDPNLVVKLCDVAPDGVSSLVTTGWLRGSHRESHEHPRPMAPGEISEMNIEIRPTAYCFRAGHRIRLSVSCSDFPRIWPTTDGGSMTLHGGKSYPACLSLPVVRKTARKRKKPIFREPDLSYLMETPRVWLPQWRIIEDRANKNLNVDSGISTEFPIPSGGNFTLTHNYRASLTGDGLRNPHMEVSTTCNADVGERAFVISVEAQMTTRRIDIKTKVLRDGSVFFEKNFTGNYQV